MRDPGYLQLYESGELQRRVDDAVASLERCRVCPWDCQINRLQNEWRVCRTGRYARVASYFPHFGEEDCLRGWNGSGTIFFAWCNLRLRDVKYFSRRRLSFSRSCVVPPTVFVPCSEELVARCGYPFSSAASNLSTRVGFGEVAIIDRLPVDRLRSIVTGDRPCPGIWTPPRNGRFPISTTFVE